MSVAVCHKCDRYVDTDYDVEGDFDDKTFEYTCSTCLEEEEESD